MTYITNTLTDANASATVYAALAPALTTEGYTLVDTVVISTRTHKVWKCAAANNDYGKDWYLDVAYTTTGTGSIWLSAFEFYDPATDLGYRGPFGASANAIIETTYFSRYGATGFALETNWAPKGGDVGFGLDMPVTSFSYWISVTPERVIGLTSAVATRVLYAGFYEPDPLYAAKAGANLYPLISFSTSNVLGTGAGLSGLTRCPPFTTVLSNFWYYNAVGSGPTHANYALLTPRLPSGPATAYPFAASKYALSPGPSFGQYARWGVIPDLAVVNVDATVVRGDTLTMDGSTWVLSSIVTNQCLLFRAV